MLSPWTLYSQTDSQAAFFTAVGLVFLFSLLYLVPRLRQLSGLLAGLALAAAAFFLLPYLDIAQGLHAGKRSDASAIAGTYRLNATTLILGPSGAAILINTPGREGQTYHGTWQLDRQTGGMTLNFGPAMKQQHQRLPFLPPTLLHSGTRLYACRNLEFCSPYLKS